MASPGPNGKTTSVRATGLRLEVRAVERRPSRAASPEPGSAAESADRETHNFDCEAAALGRRQVSRVSSSFARSFSPSGVAYLAMMSEYGD